MKHLLKLIIALCLISQICHAQKVITENEYKVFNDSIISLLKIAEKDTNNYIGKPFLELVKHFERNRLKINILWPTESDSHKVFPQHVYGITVKFISNEKFDFVWVNELITPTVYISFEGSKPFEKALSLLREYKGTFSKEVEEFYSDAVIKSIKFAFIDGEIYGPMKRKRLPLTKDEAITLQEE